LYVKENEVAKLFYFWINLGIGFNEDDFGARMAYLQKGMPNSWHTFIILCSDAYSKKKNSLSHWAALMAARTQ
jgi:hypothetical protein